MPDTHSESAVTWPSTYASTTRTSTAESEADDEAGDEDIDGLDALVLEPGGSRDVTKSPQHHQLRMDTWIPEPESEDEGSEAPAISEAAATSETTAASEAAASEAAASGMVAALGEAGGPLGIHPLPSMRAFIGRRGADAAAAAYAATWEDADAVSEEEGEWVLPGGAGGSSAESDPTALPGTLPQPAAPSAVPSAVPSRVRSPPLGCDEDAQADGVVPFTLDPDFDYDSIAHTERFSIARALVEGEFYDRHR